MRLIKTQLTPRTLGIENGMRVTDNLDEGAFGRELQMADVIKDGETMGTIAVLGQESFAYLVTDAESGQVVNATTFTNTDGNPIAFMLELDEAGAAGIAFTAEKAGTVWGLEDTELAALWDLAMDACTLTWTLATAEPDQVLEMLGKITINDGPTIPDEYITVDANVANAATAETLFLSVDGEGCLRLEDTRTSQGPVMLTCAEFKFDAKRGYVANIAGVMTFFEEAEAAITPHVLLKTAGDAVVLAEANIFNAGALVLEIDDTPVVYMTEVAVADIETLNLVAAEEVHLGSAMSTVIERNGLVETTPGTFTIMTGVLGDQADIWATGAGDDVEYSVDAHVAGSMSATGIGTTDARTVS